MSQTSERLIAVNDNVDTARGENDFTPMMNLFNEWFVRNTSKKIRAVWQVKGKSGTVGLNSWESESTDTSA